MLVKNMASLEYQQNWGADRHELRKPLKIEIYGELPGKPYYVRYWVSEWNDC